MDQYKRKDPKTNVVTPKNQDNGGWSCAKEEDRTKAMKRAKYMKAAERDRFPNSMSA